MAEFWIISNYLRQNSFENVEIHKLCKAVAVKYLENEKNHLRANSVREENIILQIDVGNLKQLYEAATEVIEAQSESEALLSEYYDEQIKMAYDIDQQEKIYGYDDIKTELETRQSISMYEELYCRKIEISKKMEERQIAKKYRHKEQNLLRSENDCLTFEQNLKDIERETNEVQATIQESILRLVKGSKDLEITHTSQSGFMEKKQHIAPIGERATDRNLLIKKPGLSSRLSMIFKPAKIPSAIVAPRIQTLNPTKGLDRLLQEAEILRKSMQHIPPEDNLPIVRPSIISKESKKEKPNKKVTFDLVTPEIIPMSIETPPNEADISLDIISSDHAATQPKQMTTNATKCVILENVVIKPPGAALPIKVKKDVDTSLIKEPEMNFKRKIEDDHMYACSSPQKKKRIDYDTKTVDVSPGITDSRSFMDMFIDFSKESPLEISSISTSKEVHKPCADETKKSETDDVVVVEDTKHRGSFDGFEDFFAGLTNMDSENNDNDLPKGENSFDFFDGNDNTGDDVDCGEGGFSFKF